jgi:voltage-gated potassium channel
MPAIMSISPERAAAAVDHFNVPFLLKFDPVFKLLIWLSVGLYLLELHSGSENSRAGAPAFLWIERGIAGILTLETIIRVKYLRLRYLKSPLGLIDLIAILPFWIGFFVPWSWLGVVRAMRILRLLKYFRYSRSMQLVALAFYRAKYQLRSLAFAMMVVILFGTVTLYECERKAPSGKFHSLYDSFVKVTLTTMNCAAVDPETPAGKAAALIVFFPAMAIFAGLIGVLSNAFGSVLDEFADPKTDPMALFREAKRRNRGIEELEEEYRKPADGG